MDNKNPVIQGRMGAKEEERESWQLRQGGKRRKRDGNGWGPSRRPFQR